MDAQQIGLFLSEQRRSRGLTQKDVAQALNISNKTISKWESGNGYPEITLLPELAKLYGVTVDEILAGHRQYTPEIQNALRQAEPPEKESALLPLVVLWFCLAVVALPFCIWLQRMALYPILLTVVTVLLAVLYLLALFLPASQAVAPAAESVIGRVGTVQVDIVPGLYGRVRLDGVDWQAASDMPLRAGETCIVLNICSATLMVTAVSCPEPA